LGPDGRSKGCGVAEYSNAEDAKEAIRKLNDVVLMGRPVFVREDRESEARIGFSGGRNSGHPSRGSENSTRQIYVANVGDYQGI
jgi:RNA recognition motif-containing protein